MDKIPEIELCHECGRTTIRSTQTTQLMFGGLKSPEFEMPGFYCESCRAGVVTGRDMRVSDAVLHELKRRAHAAAESETAA